MVAESNPVDMPGYFESVSYFDRPKQQNQMQITLDQTYAFLYKLNPKDRKSHQKLHFSLMTLKSLKAIEKPPTETGKLYSEILNSSCMPRPCR